MKGKALRLCWGRGERGVRMKSRKGFFTKRLVKHWNKLPSEVVESPSVEVFKRHQMWHLGTSNGLVAGFGGPSPNAPVKVIMTPVTLALLTVS